MAILNTPRGKLLKPVLTSEMKAGSDMAMNYNRPVVLGDQRIDLTGQSLKKTLQQIVVDLATPLNGGWQRFYTDFQDAASVAIPSNDAK
eukprot:CAMPEP_0197246244 /NCGR_PEP_ID=MMETSP1429-20130617/10758_1 /TAXON_ID=49237 /ORGANISM="Chaetoceros  sp., Strain UNC1202" /LENGTH=88 /DNA_ID=CAMNT_0042706863 /DNA_START=57 /DNA_END=320 /DNA_ORIENTATION=+